MAAEKISTNMIAVWTGLNAINTEPDMILQRYAENWKKACLFEQNSEAHQEG